MSEILPALRKNNLSLIMLASFIMPNVAWGQENKTEKDDTLTLRVPLSGQEYGDGLAKSGTMLNSFEVGIQNQEVIDIPIEESKRGGDFIILPIPVSSPTYGTGLVLAGLYLYDLDEKSQPSITGGGIFKTSNDSQGFGLFQQANFSQNKFKLKLTGGSAKLNYDDYGVGDDAGDKDVGIPVSRKAMSIVPSGVMRIVDNVYFGPRYRYSKSTTELREQGESNGALGFDPFGNFIENDIAVAGLGAINQFDTRDNSFYPK